MPAHLNLTQQEWLSLFADVESQLANSTPSTGGESALSPINFDSKRDVAGLIDHTLLKLDATETQVEKLCEEAVREGFKVSSCFCFGLEVSL